LNAIQKISITEVDTSALEKYTMSINLRIDGLSFIIQNLDKKTIHMESFEWLNAINWDKSLQNLTVLFKEHDLLKLSFQKHYIFIQSTDSLLIPASMFKPSKAINLYNQYLGLSNHKVFTKDNDHSGSKIILAFGIDQRVEKLISAHYKNIEWLHFSQTLITHSIKNATNEQELTLQFENNYFEVVALKNHKLEAHNYFTFSSSEEFMFNLLSFIKQIGLDIKILHIKLQGKITKASSLQVLIEKYVTNVSLEQGNISKEAAFNDLIRATNENR
jgi:hypothetical protein